MRHCSKIRSYSDNPAVTVLSMLQQLLYPLWLVVGNIQLKRGLAPSSPNSWWCCTTCACLCVVCSALPRGFTPVVSSKSNPILVFLVTSKFAMSLSGFNQKQFIGLWGQALIFDLISFWTICVWKKSSTLYPTIHNLISKICPFSQVLISHFAEVEDLLK